YEKELGGKYNQALQEYIKNKNSIDYYKKFANQTAKSIEQNALKSYKAGTIGYVEFSQAITKSLTFQSAYLEALNKYNASVIYIQYLIGYNL
ncbi:MAG: hypothetical protein SFY32_05710, partial [Bacteroidota bacterium]|nr:hypothetical protein [Bacteroidota bacterium]